MCSASGHKSKRDAEAVSWVSSGEMPLWHISIAHASVALCVIVSQHLLNDRAIIWIILALNCMFY